MNRGNRGVAFAGYGLLACSNSHDTGYQGGPGTHLDSLGISVRLPDGSNWPIRLASTDYQFDHAWHTYRLEVQGTTIRLFLDGAQRAEATDNRYRDPGQVGVYTYDMQISLRSFKVLKQ